jgi:hypothetical protein
MVFAPPYFVMRNGLYLVDYVFSAIAWSADKENALEFSFYDGAFRVVSLLSGHGLPDARVVDVDGYPLITTADDRFYLGF